MFVFEQEIPGDLLFDFQRLEAKALEVLNSLKLTAGDVVKFFPTGFTPAVLAALSAMHKLGIIPMVMHYDRDSGEYHPQTLSWAAETSELS